MHQVRFNFRCKAALLIAAGAALLGAGPLLAEGKYPDHPIRLIVPFPPGGQTDIVSRQIGAKLTPILGEQLVVDNRSGAAGTIGSGECARSKADGYTLVVATTSTHAINPTAMSTVAYDPIKDFTPITVFGTGPIAVSVHPSVPARSLKQFVADAKSHPGKYSYGSSGVASINHLGGELLKLRAGKLEMVHVPYKGSGASMQELVGGQIPVVVSTLAAALPYFRQGRVRTLAVMKERRSEGAPDIPTTAEAGVPGVIAYTYNILLGPAGTPESIVSQLNGAVTKVMADQGLVDALVKLGVDPVKASNPDRAAAMMKTELAKWAPLIQKLGLRN